jgi:DNA-binding FadR family transcriptional regulator
VPLEAVEARRLYRQVADQLRSLIDSGEYAVGSRLPTERELAEQLKISRPTVREALIALEVEGRLRIRVGSGIYVIEPAAVATTAPASVIEGPFELLRAREFLESAIAEEAARGAMRDHLARSQERFAQNFGAEKAAGPSSGRATRSTAKPLKPERAPKKKGAASSSARR